jgi:hypothetical protein
MLALEFSKLHIAMEPVHPWFIHYACAWSILYTRLSPRHYIRLSQLPSNANSLSLSLFIYYSCPIRMSVGLWTRGQRALVNKRQPGFTLCVFTLYEVVCNLRHYGATWATFEPWLVWYALLSCMLGWIYGRQVFIHADGHHICTCRYIVCIR